MGRMERTTGKAVQEDRRTEHRGERIELIEPIGLLCPTKAGSTENHRMLRPRKDVCDLIEGLHGNARRSVGTGMGGPDDRVFLNHVARHVPRSIEKHGSAATRECIPCCSGDVIGESVRLPRRGRPSGDRLEQLWMVHLLESTLQVLGGGMPTSDQQHRGIGVVGVRDSGERVGDTRTGRHEGDTELPCESCVCVGGMCGRLLVPHVYHPDAFGDTPIMGRMWPPVRVNTVSTPSARSALAITRPPVIFAIPVP